MSLFCTFVSNRKGAQPSLIGLLPPVVGVFFLRWQVSLNALKFQAIYMFPLLFLCAYPLYGTLDWEPFAPSFFTTDIQVDKAAINGALPTVD
jgi:hypothetical protein